MYDELIGNLGAQATHFHFNDETSLLLCKAADAIKELVGYIQEAERDRDEYRERLDKANDAVEELEKQLDEETEYATALNSYVPQWISVSDRLPGKIGDYIVFAFGGTWKQLSYLNINFWDGTKFFAESGFEVTHWMPLPEPPKESKE